MFQCCCSKYYYIECCLHLAIWLDKLPSSNLCKANSLGNSTQNHSGFLTWAQVSKPWWPSGLRGCVISLNLYMVCRRSTIPVVELQGVSQRNSDSGRERLRLPTASLTIVFSSGLNLYFCPYTKNNRGVTLITRYNGPTV